jgi:hypothetical protein
MSTRAMLFGVLALITLATATACGGDDDAPEEPAGSTATRSSNPPAATGTQSANATSTTVHATVTASPTSAPTATPTVTPTPSPIPTTDNTPPLVIMASNGGPLGGTASVTIRSRVGITCSIVFVLPDGTPVNVPELGEQVVGDQGLLTWTWTLDPTYPTGTAQAQVTCERSRRAALIEITP